MRNRSLTEILLSISFVLFASYVFSAPVPDTGQAKCFDDVGKQLSPCPSSGERFYGQDANYTVYPITYIKIDANGKALPDSALSWSLVKDEVTGLIWEVKTHLDGVKNYDDPHDADNTYTWYDSRPAVNGGHPGTPGNGTDTEDFLNALNDAHFGGYNDWRLPTIQELACIVDYSIPYPMVMIDGDFFPNTVADEYWSSTTTVNAVSNAWSVNFQHGNVSKPNKISSCHVRAVHGGQSGASADASRNDPGDSATGENFTDNGDGTVTDASTGLIWQQAGSAANTWEQALAYCEGLVLGGNGDWRLPNKKELRSLADYTRYNPAIMTAYFPQTDASGYWSSTTYEEKTGMAWGIEFYSGNDYWADKSKPFAVRAVRGGKSGPLDRPILFVTPDIQTVINEAGTTTFTVSNTGTGKMAWTAAVTSDSPWLTITSGGSGTDSGTISCSYTANTTTASRKATIRVTAPDAGNSPVDVTVNQSTVCTATINDELSLHIPLLSYLVPFWGAPSFWADLVYEHNPTYPAMIPFRLTSCGIIQSSVLSCKASTISEGDWTIHIPELFLPDGVNRMWVDMVISPELSSAEKIYFYIIKQGIISD